MHRQLGAPGRRQVGNLNVFNDDGAHVALLANVFIERLWRTLKYEEVYLHADDSIAQARHGIDRGLNWYNTGRAHSRLGRQSPNQAYAALLPVAKLAA